MVAATWNTVRVRGPALPPGFAALAQEAAAEGIRIPARVMAEWAAGQRFDQPGEALLAAWRGPVLAGIGGITHDPDWPGLLRMRRFHVRPAFRRQGLARHLAGLLLGTVPGRTVTVHAGTPDAPAFWTALGFAWEPALRLHCRVAPPPLASPPLAPGQHSGPYAAATCPDRMS